MSEKEIIRNFILYKNLYVGNTGFKKLPLVTKNHGWEFAHLFSEQIARFLRKNEQMSDSLKKRAICSFAHFL